VQLYQGNTTFPFKLGRKGGATVSAAKSAAARANGKLGGRPRLKKPDDKAAP
jgi:hypothetical protein